jgi:ATP-binding cassette subfamily B (MDR/TAP) protein 1
MDIKIAFWNGELEQEIYMRQLKGFVQTNQNNLVCRLNKSQYGVNKVCKLGMLA